MLMLFLCAFIMEEDLMPSMRISALGSDFTQLIEDPFTDVQFNPAELGTFDGLTIYFKPEWVTSGTGGKLNTAIFNPRLSRNVGFGLMGSYSYAKTYNISNYSMNGYFAADTLSSTQVLPSGNLFITFPFLVDGGFFGLKMMINKPYLNSSVRHYSSSADTNYYNSDTTLYQYHSWYYDGSIDKTFLWSIRGGQYLPLGNSALDFTFAVIHSQPYENNYDSSFSENFSQQIYHYDSSRTLNISRNISESYATDEKNYDIWNEKMGFGWTRYFDQGSIKFILQGSIGNGEINEQEIIQNRSFYEYRYEYTSPDTSYIQVDTLTNDYTTSSTSIISSILSDNEETGIGLEKRIENSINFLTGFRLRRGRMEIERTTPDSVKTVDTYYKVIMPIASEFFLTPTFCLRGGISLTYTDSTSETISTQEAKITSQNFKVYRSFGLGLKIRNKFRIDLFTSGSNLASLDNWKFEGIFSF